MMHRSAIDYLVEWKTRPRRKPLVIRGARQVGKSYLVSMFAEQNFSDYIEINFESDHEIKSLFSGSPEQIIKLLELRFNKIIDIENTLLFLDEIQAAPEVFAKLRYFYEDLPDMHIIAAGSLLEFILEDHTFSMPVGRIEYLHLGPMTFEEFLTASGKTMLVEYIENYSISEDFPDPVHSQLVALFKTYLIIGGMPEAVQAYLEKGSFHESEIVKASILETYADDFNKYASRVNHLRILNLFKKVPLIVGEKFKYVNIDRHDRAQSIAKSLHLLELAKITYCVKHSACNGVPLGSQVNEKKFKLIFLDVGLMATACGMSMIDIEHVDDLMMANSGSLCEQFVGQHLLYLDEFYKKPELFYWVREAKNSSAEVDYVISLGVQIIPVEVKAGKTGRLKSLHQFIKDKKVRLAVRINLAKPNILKDSHKLPGGESVEYKLFSIPFYLAGQIRRLLREI
ncbi:MAG: ATP-binding protein [Desulfobacula sp.]|jgi:uncharacterized protein|uniref:ATP-binding protein n=1 Tax=Desulfobacula sp. TaxID=2593537 RepID=UPI001D8E2576|nr:ATP-binding protein [Desulfobacula sp.]MBT3486464.1 ATP-binding protein [Desulfobacula sp.]MBT3806799.1 ATP-binding protein [Desulfobacula sp.]MBT4027094.1 ATP-binding protein [Desulfobacula sp.]MBT4197894.1 ATP-binding protein [Desulfobacula sp.]